MHILINAAPRQWLRTLQVARRLSLFSGKHSSLYLRCFKIFSWNAAPGVFSVMNLTRLQVSVDFLCSGLGAVFLLNNSEIGATNCLLTEWKISKFYQVDRRLIIIPNSHKYFWSPCIVSMSVSVTAAVYIVLKCV